MVEYTIDDIRGPTVAREMAQLKEFVLAQFNNAIADAEAAAAAAAQAVLDSLDARVGALESDMTTAQGDIVTNANAILALDGSVVKLAGAQTITGIKDVPLEATGTASNQIASSQKVKNELDNYAPMVRTTGLQTISAKIFTGSPQIKRADPTYTEMLLIDNVNRDVAVSDTHRFGIRVNDAAGNTKAALSMWNRPDGSIYLVLEGYPIVNGVATYKRKDLVQFNADGTVGP